jgi:transposase
MAVADAYGLPVAADAQSATLHEVSLVRDTLSARFTHKRPVTLIGDRAYDSDPLDRELAAEGVKLIAPHQANRSKPRTQNEWALRRYRGRWKVERLNAWLQIFRCIVIRFEYHAENYLGFVHLGCIKILLRCYL